MITIIRKPKSPHSTVTVQVYNERLEFLIELAGDCPLEVYSNALHAAIQAERQALNMDLVDPVILEKAANRHGLTLVDLDAA
jgi:hypothetical protein